MLLIDRSLETAYIAAGFDAQSDPVESIAIRNSLRADEVGPGDFALISTAEFAVLAETHRAHPQFGLSLSETGAIAMRTPVRPDEIDESSILLYDVSGTAELLARATIWPFYGIRALQWTTEPDGSSQVAILDGVAALEPAEAGFSEDLVRAWYILTEQPVVTHVLAIPNDATVDEVEPVLETLTEAFEHGYAARRDVRKALLSESSASNDRLIEVFSRLQHELDDTSRMAAYSLIARGSGGTRFPLLREIPWWSPNDDESAAKDS